MLLAFTREKAIEQRGRCDVAISGGSLPKLIAPSLIKLELEWSKVFFSFVDERLVEFTHAESTWRAVQEQIFQHIPIPSENVIKIDPSLAVDACAGLLVFVRVR